MLKKLKKRMLCFLISVALLLLFTTACGSGSEQPGGTQTSGATVSSPPATVAETTTEVTTVPETAETTAIPETSEETSTEEAAATAPVTGDYSREFFENTLFVGDSIFTGIDGYDFLPARNVFAKVGISASAIPTTAITGRMLYDITPEFNRVIIMLGTNGLNGTNTASVVSDITGIISAVISKRADTQVIVLTLPPIAAVNDYPALSNAALNEFNTAIRVTANEIGFTVIDLNARLKDENGFLKSEYSQPDGVHLTHPAYKVMLNLIQTELS